MEPKVLLFERDKNSGDLSRKPLFILKKFGLAFLLTSINFLLARKLTFYLIYTFLIFLYRRILKIIYI